MSDEELKALFEGLRQDNATAHVETKRHFDEKTAETKRHFDEKTEELKRHFGATAERLETRFETLAETVAHLDDRLTREAAGIRTEMRSGFAETSRLERLESSTH